jgi:biopolymer transport protein ExbD
MQYFGRAARMSRHHKRRKQRAGLSLVSMMDIFTILVFFLLVNSSEVEVLPNSDAVQLPESLAETKPRDTVVVLVTDTEILVQGRPVSRIADVLASDSLVIPGLKAELVAQAERALLTSGADVADREVTIMGDREIPYHLLKRVMATCTEANYGKLSLAVLQKELAPQQLAANTGGGA